MSLFRRDGPFCALFTIFLALFLIMALMFTMSLGIWLLSGDRHIAGLVGVVFSVTQAVPIFANVSVRIAYGPKSKYYPLNAKECIVATRRLRWYVWQSSLLLVLGVVTLNTDGNAPAGLSLLAYSGRLCIGLATIIVGTAIGYRSLRWSTQLKPTVTSLDS